MANLTALMQSKLYRPPTPADFVFRAGLEDALGQVLSKPLTLISAPAGYGKTTLASAWLEGLDCPKAWLSLDDSDNHLAGFLAYFLAAIQSIFPDVVLQTPVLVETPTLPPMQVIVNSLSNDLVQLTRPFLLVLDDYSVIHDSAIHELVAELLKHPPQTIHLVLTCRHDPPLPVSNLRARDQLVEIRRQGLRFSRAEIETFIQNATGMQLSERAITILEEKTEGWVVGLRLAAQSVVESEDVEQRFMHMEADNRYVLEYLAAEVLSHLPPEIQEFLLTTSILERFSGPLCDRLIGLEEPGKGQAYLEWLEKANLFIVPLDGQGIWYRYHHLFQKILNLLLNKSRPPEALALLHAQASAWFSEYHFVEEAISHALACGDEEAVIWLIEAHRHEALNWETWEKLERWLRLVSRSAIDERAELLVLEAWALNRSGLEAESSACLDQAEVLLGGKTCPEAESNRLKAEIEALRSLQRCWQGEVEEAQELAQSALEKLGFELSLARGTARMALAMALHMKGELSPAFETLYEGLREDCYHRNTYPAPLLIAMATIYWTEANPANLIQTAEYLLKLAQERDLPESLGWAHYFLGSAAYQKNDLESAKQHFAWVTGQQPPIGHVFVRAQSIFGLAASYQGQGSPAQAWEVVVTALQTALENSHLELAGEIQAFLAHLSLAQGNNREAQHWAVQSAVQVRPCSRPALYDPAVTQVRVLIDQGTPDSLKEAAQLLAELQASAEANNNTLYQITSLALQALLQEAHGKETEALDLLHQSVLLAQPGGVLRLFVDLGPRMASLVSRLQRRRTASGYLTDILQAFRAPAPMNAQNMFERLTDRELEILALLAQRLSNKEIARELVISPATVKRHTINIYQKLNTSSRREAVTVASALGLFNLYPLSV